MADTSAQKAHYPPTTKIFRMRMSSGDRSCTESINIWRQRTSGDRIGAGLGAASHPREENRSLFGTPFKNTTTKLTVKYPFCLAGTGT